MTIEEFMKKSALRAELMPLKDLGYGLGEKIRTDGGTISRQAAIDAICKCTDIYVNNLPTMIDKAEAYKAISELPSTQPEIVRCKDCIKREICRTSTTWAVAPKDDWYCADAERRTDGV